MAVGASVRHWQSKERKPMTKKILVWLLVTFFGANVSVAQAQQPAKILRIGFLVATNLAATSPRIEAFREGLRQLGYVEGKHFTIEFRFAEGKVDRVPALAAELVNLKVDFIVTGGATDTRAAKEATRTIPIVMLQDNDPVASGFVASLARPGGNITGLSTLSPELSGKQLELLKESVSKLSRVAVLGTSTNAGNAEKLREVELAAGALKLKLQNLDVLDPKDIETAFRAATKGRAEAVLVLGSPVVTSRRTRADRSRGKEPAAGDILEIRFCRSRGAYELQHELYRLGPPRRYVCGQDFERQNASRSSGGAADEVRVHRQSESGESNRSDGAAECVGKSG